MQKCRECGIPTWGTAGMSGGDESLCLECLEVLRWKVLRHAEAVNQIQFRVADPEREVMLDLLRTTGAGVSP